MSSYERYRTHTRIAQMFALIGCVISLAIVVRLVSKHPDSDRYQEGYSKGVIDEEQSTLSYCREQKRNCGCLEARAFGIPAGGITDDK